MVESDSSRVLNRRSFLRAASLLPLGTVGTVHDERLNPSAGRCLRDECVTASVTNASWGNPMHGFWPHTWYFENETDSSGVDAVQPVIDALGAPAVIGNTVGKGRKHDGGWAALRGKKEWMIRRVEPTARTPWDHMVLRHPLIPAAAVEDASGSGEIARRGHVLDAAASGEFDAYYRQFAQTLKRLSLSDKVIIRLADEHNGVGSGSGWMPASAVGNERVWKGAFRRFAEQMWTVDPEILIGFSPSILHSKGIVDRTWPGREYVDYFAFSGIHDNHNLYDRVRELTDVDCAFGINCDEATGAAVASTVWQKYLQGSRWGDTSAFGLNDAVDYSERYGVPLALAEWGLRYRYTKWSGNDNPWFIRSMWDWCRRHNVHWQTYFEAYGFDGAFLTNPDGLQDSLQAYQETFSQGTKMDYIAPYRRKRAKNRPV